MREGIRRRTFRLARLSQAQLDRVIHEGGGAQAVQDVYPASPFQQGLLFHSLYEPGSAVYVVSVGWQLTGRLDVEAFKRAWEQVLERHALLRTGFVGQELPSMVQVVRQQVPLPLQEYDWRGLSRAQQQERLAQVRQADRERGFEFAQPPLMRLTLMRTQEQEHWLIFSNHHALLDGWSMPILLQEVWSGYEAYRRGESPRLGVVRPYREYIGWLQRQDLGKAQAYWRMRLEAVEGAARQLGVDRGLPERTARWRAARGVLRARCFGGAGEAGGICARTQADGEHAGAGGVDVVDEPVQRQPGCGVWGDGVGTTDGVGGCGAASGIVHQHAAVAGAGRGGTGVMSLLQEVQRRQGELIEYQYTPLPEVRRWSGLARRDPAVRDGIRVRELSGGYRPRHCGSRRFALREWADRADPIRRTSLVLQHGGRRAGHPVVLRRSAF